jgi:hypothetical protein
MKFSFSPVYQLTPLRAASHESESATHKKVIYAAMQQGKKSTLVRGKGGTLLYLSRDIPADKELYKVALSEMRGSRKCIITFHVIISVLSVLSCPALRPVFCVFAFASNSQVAAVKILPFF